MIRKSLWDEFKPNWLLGFWDDWVRKAPWHRKEWSCVRPEIPRTRPLGREDVLIKDKSLPATREKSAKTDRFYLLKEDCDKTFAERVDPFRFVFSFVFFILIYHIFISIQAYIRAQNNF